MRKWLKAASRQASLEYVICFDYGRHDIDPRDYEPARIVWNYNLPCSVDATNHACQAAVGQVLVVVSDDIMPCECWDRKLSEIPQLWGQDPCCVRVSTGGTADARRLMAVQILNRVRYEQIGYLFCPAYLSMFADDEYSVRADQDKVVVDAEHIRFPHYHWCHEGELNRPTDPVYQSQNAPERYAWGEALIRYRMATQFSGQLPDGIMEARRDHFYNAPKEASNAA